MRRVFVNLGFKPAPGHTFELRSQYYEGWEIGIPGARDSVPLTALDAEYKKIQRALGSIDYKLIPGTTVWIDSKLHIYWMCLKREVQIDIPNAVSETIRTEPESDNRTTGIQWTNTFIYENNKLMAGVDSWLRTISTDRKRTNITTGAAVINDTPIPDAYYLSSGVFAEDDYKLADFIFNLGGRFDGIFTGNDKIYKSEYPVSTVVLWEEKMCVIIPGTDMQGQAISFLKDSQTGYLLQAATGLHHLKNVINI
jgi:hypothetical protein